MIADPCLAQSIDTKAILDVPDPCPETSQPREFGLTPRLRVAQLTESCAMARPLEDQPNRRSNAITVVGFPTYAMMLHGRGHCRRLTRSAPKPPDACDGSIWPVPAFVHMRTSKRLLCSSPEGGAKRAGKTPTTQAGEFMREEIHKVRRGEYGARSPQQLIAIGLSKARCGQRSLFRRQEPSCALRVADRTAC